jgi:hypothetical protein
MSNDDFFLNMFNALSDEDFEEIPVEIEEFVTSDKFLNLPPLSEYQYQMIKAGSQIYKYETLVALYGEEKAHKRFKETYNEIILQLGKGSGKDYTSTIACSYIVYLLLCLKDPASYYGKPSDDSIDIINIAINSDQAKNVFFKNFKKRIEKCPWFAGKFNPTAVSIEFIKSVNVYSGHSEREAFEGLNLFAAVLDEISAFGLESTTGNVHANTADATYKMYRASVDSRFPDFGKVFLLSFPRYKGDYIQMKYENDDPNLGPLGAVAEKEVIVRSYHFKIDPDLPDGYEGNEFDIEWEEDHIIRYNDPGVFALKRPTWEVNPTVRIDSPAMIRQFRTNLADALGRFACMPSDSTDDAFFKNKEAIVNSFVIKNGVDDNGVFLDDFKPLPNTKYYVHVDLSKVHDRCAVALSHVEKWIDVQVGDHYRELHPFVKVDAVRWWKPSHDKPMDYKEVVDYIVALKHRGFDLKLVTFDRWNSNDTMNLLNQYHIKTELLSVANKHYDDFLSIMYDQRLVGPGIPELIDELRMLRYIKDKVDHPRSGFKDLSDAVCGAIFNAVTHTPKPVNEEVEVLTYAQLRAKMRAELAAVQEEPSRPGEVIAPPKREKPEWLEDYLAKATLL